MDTGGAPPPLGTGLTTTPPMFELPKFHCATGALKPRAWAISAESSRVLHLVRHAQGEHNLAAALHGVSAFTRSELFDAALDATGVRQAAELGRAVDASHLGVQLVLCSPMTRTLQTLQGIYPFGRTLSGESVRIIAIEELREAFGAHPCDSRRAISHYRSLFPWVDFSHVQTDADTWAGPQRETVRDVAQRADAFLEILAALPERRIMVISHGVLLEILLNRSSLAVPDPAARSRRFDNAELRTIIVSAWSDAPTPSHAASSYGAAPSATGSRS